VPTAILLVGGPGNGKTDAVDGLVEDLDDALGLDGKLFRAFAVEYTGANADDPPRRVSVDLASLIAQPPDHLKRTIAIVQDATEADPTRYPGRSAQALLLDELREIAGDSSGDIYVCCVNRGKLAEAYTEAQVQGTSAETLHLLTEITTAVTNSPEAKPCWPLRQFPTVVAWPMDIDSLVDPDSPDGERPVVQQIMATAIDESRWPRTCPAGEMCPFCTNQRMLAQDGALDRLAELLRAFELGTGKRWTFRDLYSLVPYMLAGDDEELVLDGNRLDPCQWAAMQLEILESTRKSDAARRARALYSLVARLYWHRLFPRWPRLSSQEFTDARKRIAKPLKHELSHVEDLFRYLTWAGRTSVTESIAKLISRSFCNLLDPADAHPDEVISTASTRSFTVREVDEFFSLSVGQGLKLIQRRIPALERELFKRLAAADDALGTDAISSPNRPKADLLQRCIRMFAARLAKRSVGTQAGIYANRSNLIGYKSALRDPEKLRLVQNELKKLINDQQRNLFVVPLMTTFAQPTPPRRRSVNLETTVVKVLPWRTEPTERPQPQIAYLKVGDDPVPLTFELYCALRQLRRGMHPGSLNDEVFAMVDRVRARVAGEVVRDEDRLLDDAVIVLGATGEEIRFTGKEFVVERGESAR